MQTLSEIPELVTCFPYSPKPRPHRDGKLIPHAPRQLVMELMEARLRRLAPADWMAVLCATESCSWLRRDHSCIGHIKPLLWLSYSCVEQSQTCEQERCCCQRLIVRKHMMHAGW